MTDRLDDDRPRWLPTALDRRSVLRVVGSGTVLGVLPTVSADEDDEDDDEGDEGDDDNEGEGDEGDDDNEGDEDDEGEGDDEDELRFSIVQGDRCFEVEPLDGDLPVERRYDLQIPGYFEGDNGATDRGGPYYRSLGTTDLQRENTTTAFLYDGPGGVHLVVVHDTVDGTGGSATWRLTDVPEEADWVVKDELYFDPDTGDPAVTNYDNWDVSGTDHRIDWTWDDWLTDGGALGPLEEDLSVSIEPAYNEAATLWNEYYSGWVTDWEFLSATDDGIERVSLALDETVRIRSRPCIEDRRDRGRGDGEGHGDDRRDRGRGDGGRSRGSGDDGRGRGRGDRGGDDDGGGRGSA